MALLLGALFTVLLGLELVQRLVGELRSLSEPYRSTLVRRFYDGLPPAEIGRASGFTATP